MPTHFKALVYTVIHFQDCWEPLAHDRVRVRLYLQRNAVTNRANRADQNTTLY